MEHRTLERTCTVCPRGCRLTIRVDGSRVSVEGHACPKGEDYGIEEATQPQRILTTTVRTTAAAKPRIPVRSSRAVPLNQFRVLMGRINSVTVSPPVRCGDVIVRNLADSGADLIATDALE